MIGKQPSLEELHRLAVLAALEQRFDAQLAVLQQPDVARKIASLFESKGKLNKPPKVGASF